MNIVVYFNLATDYRAYAQVDPPDCEACGICVEVCPYAVPFIHQEGYAEISPEACRGCGVCASACKTQAIRMRHTLDMAPYFLPAEEPEGLRSRLDKNAIEAGLALRDQEGGRVWVFGAGPPRVKEAVREALVMGADEGVLLCDARFLGSDQMATALILQSAVEKIGGCDLFIAPHRSRFGEPFLFGAWLAERMGMAYMSSVSELAPAGGRLLVKRKRGQELLEFSMSLPAVLTVESGINEPRGLSLLGAGLALRKSISVWSASDLGIQLHGIGEAGSHVLLTQVKALPRVKGKKRAQGEILKGAPDLLAQGLIERLKRWNMI